MAPPGVGAREQEHQPGEELNDRQTPPVGELLGVAGRALAADPCP